MSESKCRLCLCLVDKRMSFFCSLNDDSFRTMIKTVFPFPVQADFTVANKIYNLPVLVCFLCSTTVRNFYSFSKLAEANQKTLETECFSREAGFNNLIQNIKAEPGAGFEASNDELRMPSDAEATDSENGSHACADEPLIEDSSDPLDATSYVIDHGYTRMDQLPINHNFVDKAPPKTLATQGSMKKWVQKPAQRHLLFTQKVVLRLINAVKAYPCIWKMRDQSYKNMIAKDVAWSAIASKLGGNVEDLRKKWRNLTIQFYNNRKKQRMAMRNGLDKETPSWYAYTALEFLGQTSTRPRVTKMVLVDQTNERSEPDDEDAQIK